MANVLILQNPAINTDDLKVEVLDAENNDITHQSFLVGAGNQITGHLNPGIVIRVSISPKTVPESPPSDSTAANASVIMGVDGHQLDRKLGSGILVPGGLHS